MSRKNDEWFEATYPKCLDALKKYLRRFVGSRETAEDLAHDAFLRVWTAPNFDQSRLTQGYLFTTARNLAWDRSKLHRVARMDAAVEVTDMPDEQASVEQQAMTAEEFETICRAMNRLPERRQQVLVLSAFFGFSGQDIADHLRISRTTVHRELGRAIETVHAARALIEAEKASRNAQVIALDRDGDSGT